MRESFCGRLNGATLCHQLARYSCLKRRLFQQFAVCIVVFDCGVINFLATGISDSSGRGIGDDLHRSGATQNAFVIGKFHASFRAA